MNPNKILKNLSQKAAPDSKYKKKLWLSLDTKAKDIDPGVKFGFFARPAFKYAVVPVVIIFFFILGTGAYAYQSTEVTVEHPLYSVKQGLENVEGRFKFSPEAKANFHLKMMNRRIEEAKKLGQNNQYNNQTLKKIFQELDLSLGQTQEIEKTTKRQSLVEALGKTDEENLEHLEKLLEQLPTETQAEIEQMITEQTKNLEGKLESLDKKERQLFEQSLQQRKNMIKKKNQPPPPPKKPIKTNQGSQKPLNIQKGRVSIN